MSTQDTTTAAAPAAGGKRSFFKRRKTCPFSGPNAPAIDWKDPRTLNRYVSERGKMMPSRITAVSQKKQRELAKAIKRARFMALMAPVRTEPENSR
ncbi:MAG TPA: 30S ribosomal protein S18 [Micavibrio sp.]